MSCSWEAQQTCWQILARRQGPRHRRPAANQGTEAPRGRINPPKVGEQR